jgi:hypothetical protein
MVAMKPIAIDSHEKRGESQYTFRCEHCNANVEITMDLEEDRHRLVQLELENRDLLSLIEEDGPLDQDDEELTCSDSAPDLPDTENGTVSEG